MWEDKGLSPHPVHVTNHFKLLAESMDVPLLFFGEMLSKGTVAAVPPLLTESRSQDFDRE